MSPRTVEHMTWHQSHNTVDGVIVHPSDSEAWKHFNSVHPRFSDESRNVHLGLCTDEFNPFGSFTAPYSCWPVILVARRKIRAASAGDSFRSRFALLVRWSRHLVIS